MTSVDPTKIEEWAACAFGSLFVVGFFAVSIAVFVGSLLFLAVVLREAWQVLF